MIYMQYDIRDIDKYFDDFYKKVELFGRRILNEANKLSKGVIERTRIDFGFYQRDKIEQLFNEAVNKFYSSYTPSQYERTWGLYDVLNISQNGYGEVIYDDVIDLLDPSRLHTDRKGGDLFEKVFMHGWHGGAEAIYSNEELWGSHPSTSGVPYYRKPGFITLPNGAKVWHRWGQWGKRAVQTIAPAEILYNSLVSSEYGEMRKKAEEIFRKHNDDMVDYINQEIMPTVAAEVFG